MQQVKIAELLGNRIETGAVCFTYPNGETDWPGLYIRGDNSMALLMAINGLIKFVAPSDIIGQFHLQELKGFAQIISEDVLQRTQNGLPPQTNP